MLERDQLVPSIFQASRYAGSTLREHAIAVLALAHQHLAALRGDDADLRGQPPEIVRRQRGEERHRGQARERSVGQHGPV